MRKVFLPFAAALAGAAFARLSSAEEMVALTIDNHLVFFDSATPSIITRNVTITGFASGERLLGIDYRPANGGLYALGSLSRLYLVNGATGAATAVGNAGAFTLTGNNFGFNFNPTVDRIRVVSDTEQNLRLNPNDGTLAAADTALAYNVGDRNFGVNPNVIASAYTNSFAGAGATVLYGIDSGTDTLVIQNPPNAGGLITVGNLGVNAADKVGFDISGVTGRAYASLSVNNAAGLYTIDLVTGAATLVGPIGTEGSTANVIALAAFTPTRVVNFSARGQVGTGANVLIGGFVNRGRATSRVVVRALGPSLTAAGVTGALSDPILTIYDSAGTVVATGDDFGTPADNALAVANAGLAPTNTLEAAILVSVAPGAYTAVVSGKGGATGVALVEIYELP